VITGEFDGPTLHHFQHLAVEFGISGRVIAPGVVDDDTLLALYQGAELVCFASLAEGFGLPIAEAAATGTPVIGPDVAPMSDLLGLLGTVRSDVGRGDRQRAQQRVD